MHICFVCHEYPPHRHGGVGSVTRTLARGLVGRGHAVTVVGCYGGVEGETEDEGVRVVRVPRTGVPRVGFVVNGVRLHRALWRIHRDRPIDLVEGSELGLALVPRDLPCRKLIRMHGGHHFFSVTLGGRPRPWRSWMERRSFGRATDLCAVSHYVADETSRLLSLHERSVEVIPNSVDTEHFRPTSETAEVDGRITFVGTLCEKKGIRQLIEAMPRILDRVPGARLLVAGRDTLDPGTRQSFRRRLESAMPASVQSRVEFLGTVPQSDLPTLMAAAAACVYPSHMEAMPVAWLEGMAMGKAVVASETGPGPEVIEHGRSGWLCNPHDPGSIAQGVTRLLRDGVLRQRLGRAARARVLEEFSRERLVGRSEALYTECISHA